MRFSEAVAEVFQNGDRGNGFSADNPAEITGGTAATPGSVLIVQTVLVTKPGQRIRQGVDVHEKHFLSVEDGFIIRFHRPFTRKRASCFYNFSIKTRLADFPDSPRFPFP